jgi:shikimate dehydrogenase
MLKLGLVGQHITKSLTQTFFQELSEIYNIELSYDLFDTFNQNISIEEKLKELSDKGYMGLNITYPYKEEIFQIINSKSEEVKLVQSINTVMIDNSAYNTDYLGFRHILKVNDIQNNINVLIIGSGGVGRSVANACGKELNANIYLYDINLLKSEKLHLGLKENKINSEVLNENSYISQLNNIDLICNCSSVGHYQNPGNPLSEIKDCKENTIFFDAVYTPSNTEFLSQAKKYGFKTIGGLELFIYQGIESFLIFTKRNELREKLMKSSKQFISKYQNLS